MSYAPRTLTAIATVSLLAAFAAQANKGAEYKPHHKDHHKNFFITGGATYLEPSFNGLDYVAILTTPSGSTPSINTEVVEPGFNWGYFIQAGYRISHHYDIEASWAQYNSNLSDSIAVTGETGAFTGVQTSNGQSLSPNPVGVTVVGESDQNINYSVFDANLGQYHDITEMLRARLFAGINYAKIDSDTDNTYSVVGTTDVLFDNYDSSFSGFGPEVGMDLEYKIWHTFGVVGHFAVAFLIGQQESDSYIFADSEQVSVDTDSTTRMIPAMDAKLGVNWNVPYAYEKCSFGVEAGYQVAYYWDVIDQVQVPGFTGTVVHNYADYGNMGPYLNVTAMF